MNIFLLYSTFQVEKQVFTQVFYSEKLWFPYYSNVNT